MKQLLKDLLGDPVVLEDLKNKPGRRRTVRARGARGTAIVKQYHSRRFATVAERLTALASGPSEPRVPRVLGVDPDAHIVVLSDIPGEPLRLALLDCDRRECARVGAAIARWHSFWRDDAPGALSAHTPERELEILEERARATDRSIGDRVRTAARFGLRWRADTVVHRDLYEEQVMLSEQIGLIDLDDAALGPPELDVGNLLAHLDLLELRSGRDLGTAGTALLKGYGGAGVSLEPELLAACRQIARLRLSCIHREPRLLDDTWMMRASFDANDP